MTMEQKSKVHKLHDEQKVLTSVLCASEVLILRPHLRKTFVCSK